MSGATEGDDTLPNYDTCEICGGDDHSCTCTPDEQEAYYAKQRLSRAAPDTNEGETT